MTMTIHFELNGRSVSFDGDPETPLLWAVRDDFGLTGTKYGCGVAQCGACTVHLAGKPLRSCVTPVALIAAKRVTTIEGVNGALAEAVRAAWVKLDVPQCGYCQSGQIMAAIALLSESPRPTDAEIDAALAGNICRCAAYQRIRRAIHAAAQSSSA
jgi:isoquinoline 1-oxidoreductase subunit alpha